MKKIFIYNKASKKQLTQALEEKIKGQIKMDSKLNSKPVSDQLQLINKPYKKDKKSDISTRTWYVFNLMISRFSKSFLFFSQIFLQLLKVQIVFGISGSHNFVCGADFVHRVLI